MNHKRKRPPTGEMRKLLKINGFSTERVEGEKFSDHRRRSIADEEIRDAYYRQMDAHL